MKDKVRAAGADIPSPAQLRERTRALGIDAGKAFNSDPPQAPAGNGSLLKSVIDIAKIGQDFERDLLRDQVKRLEQLHRLRGRWIWFWFFVALIEAAILWSSK